jgi:hypothetical protein
LGWCAQHPGGTPTRYPDDIVSVFREHRVSVLFRHTWT